MNADWIISLAGWAWTVSCSSFLPAALLLILTRTRWLPARWGMWLAVLVLARLLLPAVPVVDWNPLAHHIASSSTAPAATAEASAKLVPAGGQNLFAQAPQQGVPAINIASMAAWIWAIGVLAVLSWAIASAWRVRIWLRDAIAPDTRLQGIWQEACQTGGCQLRVPLLLVPCVDTVAVHGVIRPRLLAPLTLSARYSDAELRSMFLHEIAHLRRNDVLWTWVGMLACALHWFNPLAWAALRRFNADRELVCDDFALRCLVAQDRLQYGQTLLKLLSEAPAPTPVIVAPFFRSTAELKHRLHLIMKPYQHNVWTRLLAVVAVPALTFSTLTIARADGEGVRRPRDGESGKETPREGARDGERKTTGPRDGERSKDGARDGERPREGARDGERSKEGARDGERPREGTSDGERSKTGARDGERPREGARDGERGKEGVREGERPREGARDGDRGKEGAGEGERPREGAGESKASSERAAPGAAPAGGIVVTLNDSGDVVSSDGWVVPDDTVRERLKAMAVKNAEQQVTIRAPSAASLKKIIALMQVMEEAGLKHVQLATAAK